MCSWPLSRSPSRIDSLAEKLDSVQLELREHETALREHDAALSDVQEVQEAQLELGAQLVHDVTSTMEKAETQLVQIWAFPRRVRADRMRRPPVAPAAAAVEYAEAPVEAPAALD